MFMTQIHLLTLWCFPPHQIIHHITVRVQQTRQNLVLQLRRDLGDSTQLISHCNHVKTSPGPETPANHWGFYAKEAFSKDGYQTVYMESGLTFFCIYNILSLMHSRLKITIISPEVTFKGSNHQESNLHSSSDIKEFDVQSNFQNSKHFPEWKKRAFMKRSCKNVSFWSVLLLT